MGLGLGFPAAVARDGGTHRFPIFKRRSAVKTRSPSPPTHLAVSAQHVSSAQMEPCSDGATSVRYTHTQSRITNCAETHTRPRTSINHESARQCKAAAAAVAAAAPAPDLLFDIFEFVFSPVGFAGIGAAVALALLYATRFLLSSPAKQRFLRVLPPSPAFPRFSDPAPLPPSSRRSWATILAPRQLVLNVVCVCGEHLSLFVHTHGHVHVAETAAWKTPAAETAVPRPASHHRSNQHCRKPMRWCRLLRLHRWVSRVDTASAEACLVCWWARGVVGGWVLGHVCKRERERERERERKRERV